MGATAIAAYTILSGLSLGIIPAATIAIATVYFVVSVISNWWVKKIDHVKNLKIDLLTERLNNKINKGALGLDYTRKMMVHGKGFFKKEISLKEYLQNMKKNPTKLKEIVIALENNDKEAFKKALGTHRSYKLFGGFGKTTGNKIYSCLQQNNAH
ncbi:MAG: hypothetical protein ACD_45C00384G0001 [uncultured bacterium]|nr:MAG: hypothetical protein ACD_45C00384G0001 [uncultured bacterium]